jgi:hypothetical protein
MYEIHLPGLKAVDLAASREATRYYLNGVNLEFGSQGIIATATNGHILLCIRVSEQPCDKSFSLIVPSEAIKPMMVHKTETDPLRLYQKDKTTWQAESSEGIWRIKPIDGTFPDWRRVVPGCSLASPKIPDTRTAATFNPVYIDTIAKAMKVYTGSRTAVPKFWSDGDNASLVFLGEGIPGFGVIMPYREYTGGTQSAKKPVMPDWALDPAMLKQQRLKAAA